MDGQNKAGALDTLPQDCQDALSAHIRNLSGETLDVSESALIQEHARSCDACREHIQILNASDRALRGAIKTAAPSSGFVARTMAALPASAASAAPATHIRVFGSTEKPARQTAFWKRAAIAAVVLLMAGVGATLAFKTLGRTPGLSIQHGAIVDAQGRALNSVPLNTVCTAQEDTLIRGHHAEMINVRKGARFTVRDTNERSPELQLASGDVYAVAAAGEPVRLQCPHFDAEMSSGDCFVAHQTGELPQSVMIVFEGSAKVTAPRHDAMPLHSGQVFVCVGAANSEDTFAETLELNGIAAAPDPAPVAADGKDPATVRKHYEKVVSDYRTELATLNRRIAGGEDNAELRERSARVNKYLEAHEARLRAMTELGPPVRIPLDFIKRGINGHTDPRTWM